MEFAVNCRKRKRQISRLYDARLHGPSSTWPSAEERAWLDITPVGREFGSPDYERLEQEDHQRVRSNLKELVDFCSSAKSGVADLLDDREQRVAANVQQALCELGHDVTIEVAAAVWRHYSQALAANWMSGAESANRVKWMLISHCNYSGVVQLGPQNELNNE